MSASEVFVSDFNNNRVQVFSPAGAYLRSWGTGGAEDGQFANPTGISLAPDGTLAVGDDLNFRIQVFAPDGTFVRAFGSEGAGEGQVAGPRGMDHDADGNLWVAERDNSRIQQFAPDGTSLGVLTEGSDGRPLNQPYDVAVGADGRLYVADRGNGRIQVLEADGRPVEATAVAGGAAADFDPIAIGLGVDGAVLVGDIGNERVLTYRQAGGRSGLLNGLRTAVLATGERASDALVAGPAAYDGGFPLLLTGAAALPQPTADVLAELDIEQVIVVGGTAAVSDDVVNAVQQREVVVQRVSGPDRVATALAFARFTYDQMGFRQDTLNLASGAATAFPDTLSLGPQGGLERGAILLTSGGDTLDPALEAFFTATGPCTVRLLSVAGGTAVVSDAVVDGVRAAVRYEPACEPGPEPTPSPGGSGGPGAPGDPGEPPTEPEEPVGGLTVTPADTSPMVGEELAVEIAGADPVRVEVYEEVDDGAGGTSRLLRDAVEATLNGGPYTYTYTSNAPRTERIVACVVPEGESCTTVTDDPLDAGEVFLRDDVEAIASATVTWTASQLAPLVSGPEGDDDATGVVHTAVSGDLLCYGIAGVTGLALPATAATVRDAEGTVVAALSPPAVVGDPLAPGDVGGAAGCVEGVDPAVLSSLGGTPEAFTARIDTDEHPDGALAAPLRTASSIGRALALADLSGAALGEDGAIAGLGTVSVSVDTTRGLICAGAFVRGVELPATALRVHRGGPDGAGPAVLELPPPNATGEVFGCVGAEGLTAAASATEVADLAATPSDYSVVVTTPDGALSGPLVTP